MFFFFPIGGGGGGFLIILIMLFLAGRVFRALFGSRYNGNDDEQYRNSNQRRYYYYRFDSGSQGQQSYGTRQNSSVADPYSVLGIPSTSTEADIKKRYRKLILENHPDSLASRGIEGKAKEEAVKRFRDVQEAYERICRERGIK
ncbi:MAG: DnaJ domain-containing protein [Sphaerochaetaceae bacterium]|nr:DnaJ domain-containing protein [Sphaerochaetaceae bacterium]